MADQQVAPERIRPETSVREILTRFPSAEAVFEQHGLLGCGGPNGPQEPVGFFARVHRVDPAVLLQELNEHVAHAAPVDPEKPSRAPAVVVYPLFMVLSLVIAIFAGFTTGIVALASEALGWTVPFVNWFVLIEAHGRLQLFGFAGLFVFGVAFHVVPRFVATPLAHTWMARTTLWLVLAGLLLSLAQLIQGGDLAAFHLVFALGLALLVLAAVFYAIVIWRTVFASEQPRALPLVFMLAGSLWLIFGAALETILGLQSVPGQPIQSAIEEPALEAILEGFVVVTALGVSLRTLPVFAGLGATRERVMPFAFGATQAGLAGLVGGLVLAGDFGRIGLGQAIAAGGAVVLFGAVVAFVWALRLFAPSALPIADLGTGQGWARAVRYAYGWLLIGLAIQVIGTARAAILGTVILWGTLGAARHAFALGFVTLMIVGMASRVIPVFAGKPLWKAWLVDLAAGLLVASVALRVPLEALTPYGTSLPTDILLTLSGPLALAGLLVFTVNFALTMMRRDRPAVAAAAPATPAPARPLAGDDLLAEALRRPGGLNRLLGLGLTYLAEPGHRAIAARSLTIAQAARRADRDPVWLIEQLNQTSTNPSAAQNGSAVNSGGPMTDRSNAPRPTLDPDQTVAAVLDSVPGALDVFLRHGFAPLADPDLRAKLAPTISVRQACLGHGVDLKKLLADLRAASKS